MDWEPYSGRKVVCLLFDGQWEHWKCEILPIENCVYTIREVILSQRPDMPRALFLRFFEIMNPLMPYINGVQECSFDAAQFRPLDERKTDISVFKKLLLPHNLERAL